MSCMVQSHLDYKQDVYIAVLLANLQYHVALLPFLFDTLTDTHTDLYSEQ